MILKLVLFIVISGSVTTILFHSCEVKKKNEKIISISPLEDTLNYMNDINLLSDFNINKDFSKINESLIQIRNNACVDTTLGWYLGNDYIDIEFNKSKNVNEFTNINSIRVLRYKMHANVKKEDITDLKEIYLDCKSLSINNGVFIGENGIKIECYKNLEENRRRFYIHLSKIIDRKGIEIFWIFQSNPGVYYLKRVINEKL